MIVVTVSLGRCWASRTAFKSLHTGHFVLACGFVVSTVTDCVIHHGRDIQGADEFSAEALYDPASALGT